MASVTEPANPHERERRCQRILRLTNNLLDCEIHVDDTRAELEAVVAKLQLGIARRDDAAQQLARAIAGRTGSVTIRPVQPYGAAARDVA